MDTKLCRTCGEMKGINLFGLDCKSPDGHRYLCKACRSRKERASYSKDKSKHVERQIRYKRANREKIREAGRAYYRAHKQEYAKRKRTAEAKKADRRYRLEHREEIAEWNKRYCRKNAARLKRYRRIYQRNNRERIALRKKQWVKKNRERVRERVREWQRERRRTNPSARLLNNMRRRIPKALHGECKSAATMVLVGCTIEELKVYLEAAFLPGMSWENYGRDGWHVDHIIPCSRFDLSNPEEQRKCFHYSNLRPLWAIDNLRKRDKVV